MNHLPSVIDTIHRTLIPMKPLKSLFWSLTLFLCTGLSSLAQGDYPTAGSVLFMKLEGVKSGVVQGEVVQKGREGLHKLLAYSHEITSPRDPASGQATGKRQHEPFRVVKYVNRASPTLLTMMANNELLKSVTIDIWDANRTGAEQKLITYTLKNAQIVSLRPWMPNKSDASAASYGPAEELAFVYETIQVTWNSGGIVGEDRWSGVP